MSHFIELEASGSVVNVDKIVAIVTEKYKDYEITVIHLDGALEKIYTGETPEEIMQKIHEGVSADEPV